MKILFKKTTERIYIFISDRGDQMDPKIDQKGGPIKSRISQVRSLKYEKTRHFCNVIAKLLEKTRVFDVPGPPRPP